MRKNISILILSLFALLFLFIGKPYLQAHFENEPLPDKAPYKGIIHVWHVVGFKPYSGSLGNALQNAAGRIESKERGVFFEVIAMLPEEYQMRKARGEHPDVLSFPASFSHSEPLYSLDPAFEMLLPEAWRENGTDAATGAVKALPYAASKKVVFVNASMMEQFEVPFVNTPIDENRLLEICDSLASEIAEHGSKNIRTVAGEARFFRELSAKTDVGGMDEFREGKAVLAVGDLRLLQETQTHLKNGKAVPFHAVPFEGEETLVQFIGICGYDNAEKIPYAQEFIRILFDEAVQKQLIALGLVSPYPALYGETEADMPMLREYRDSFDPDRITPLA